MTDVIVAGAGPAGSITALLLARAGRDVVLIDRAAFPRPKPCGDCLSIGATALLDRLGLLPQVLAAPHAKLTGWRIAAPDGSAVDATFAPTRDSPSMHSRGAIMPAGHGCALAVERSVFDAILVAAARDAGASFQRHAVTGIERDRCGTVIGVRARERVLRARVTVGADGLRSVIAKRLDTGCRAGALRKFSLTFHLPVADVDVAGEMHVGDGVCVGVAPVDGEGRCNITIVADTRRFGRSAATDRAGFVHAAIDALPLLHGRVSRADLAAAIPLASGPFDRPVRRIAHDGAVLVGDAAGYYDPFTGQGVYQALASAALLAPVIDDALYRRSISAHDLRGYTRARAALLAGPRRVQLGIEAVLSRPSVTNHAIARIRRAPAFARALLAVTGDIAPASALLSRASLASLFLPVHPETAA